MFLALECQVCSHHLKLSARQNINMARRGRHAQECCWAEGMGRLEVLCLLHFGAFSPWPQMLLRMEICIWVRVGTSLGCFHSLAGVSLQDCVGSTRLGGCTDMSLCVPRAQGYSTGSLVLCRLTLLSADCVSFCHELLQPSLSQTRMRYFLL